MGKKSEKRAARRGCSSGRGRKRKKARGELLVGDTTYRPRQRSYWLCWKKIEAIRPSCYKKIQKESEAIRKAEELAWQQAMQKALDEWNNAFEKGRPGSFWGHGNDCPLVVRLYAKLGLHRYNMLEGTNLQLQSIVKYNRGAFLMPASYFITLLAEDPAAATPSPVTFQTNVGEKSCNEMNHICSVARVKEPGAKVHPNTIHFPFDEEDVPGWPTKMALADRKRFFYELKESDWEENDWIRLYLELAFVTTKRPVKNPNLSALKIVNVVVETEEQHVEPLKCLTNGTVYISYHHILGEPGVVCKRRATVRRVVDMVTKTFCVFGIDLPAPEEDLE